MTEKLDLEEMERLEKAATGGPWKGIGGYVTVRDERSFSLSIYLRSAAFQAIEFARVEDADFIASARTFVPLAIDCEGVDLRLARAEAQLKDVRATRYQWELLLPDDRKP